MKKILILVGIICFFACEKTIDIEYNQKPETTTTENNQNNNNTDNNNTDIDSLVGVWEGPMICPTCCDKKYAYRFTITKHNGNELEGTVRISEVPNHQYYVLFKLDITYQNNTMTLTNGDGSYILEQNRGNRCGDYCLNNTYVLTLSEDKQHLDGEWTKSSNCQVENVDSPINLEKL